METKIHDGIGIITLHKLMGLPETDDLNNEVNHLLEQGISNIILDLKAIDWIGSNGVGTLIRNLTTTKNKNGSLHLANISEKASHVLKVTQLLKFFNIHNSLEEANTAIKENH